MADPYAIWRAAEGKSVRKSVTTFWPELAAALDAGAGGAPQPGQRPPERPDCQVKGQFCVGKAAGKLVNSGRYACIPCWGGHSDFVRNPEWTLQRNGRTRPRWGES